MSQGDLANVAYFHFTDEEIQPCPLPPRFIHTAGRCLGSLQGGPSFYCGIKGQQTA